MAVSCGRVGTFNPAQRHLAVLSAGAERVASTIGGLAIKPNDVGAGGQFHFGFSRDQRWHRFTGQLGLDDHPDSLERRVIGLVSGFTFSFFSRSLAPPFPRCRCRQLLRALRAEFGELAGAGKQCASNEPTAVL